MSPSSCLSHKYCTDCRIPDWFRPSHRLYVYLRANVDQAHTDLATDGIRCKTCSQEINQGPIYRECIGIH